MITTTPLPQDPDLHELPQVAAAAYKKILLAETHAIHDKADENVALARVVGHILLELYTQRHTFGDLPFTRVAEDVILSPRHNGDVPHVDTVVFEVGQQSRDCLIRPRTFGCFPVLVVQHLNRLKSGPLLIHPLPTVRWKI